MVRLVVAHTAHALPSRPPIQLAAGDRVRVAERDDEWPAFVFVSCARGAGWVPERHLDRDGSSAVVKEPYDTTELATRKGQQFEVLSEDRLSGWIWCRAASGREGWIPARALTPVG